MGLHTLAEAGNASELARLIDKKTENVNEFDDYGESPLHYACCVGSSECVKLLLQEGANANATNENGITPLHHAARLGRIDCLALLIKAGANVQSTDHHRWTPLHYAVFNGQTDAAALLIDSKADISAVNTDSCQPIHLAASAGAVDCIKLLLERGADPTVRDKAGNTALCLLPITEKVSAKVLHADSFRQLGGELKGLVNNQDFSDIIFVFKEKQGDEEKKDDSTTNKTIVYGHKCIISQRSKHFKDMIAGSSQTQETVGNQTVSKLRIKGVSPNIFTCFLEFLYSGDVEVLAKAKRQPGSGSSGMRGDTIPLLLAELLRLADLYHLSTLQSFCENLLSNGGIISAEAAITFLARCAGVESSNYRRASIGTGETHQFTLRVQQVCQEYLAEHFNTVADLAAFNALPLKETTTKILLPLLNALTVERKPKPEYEKRLQTVDNPELMTKDTLKKCKAIMKRVMTTDVSWPFNQPVDPIALGIPTYFDIIKHPMDFGTIKNRLGTKYYHDIKAFGADVRLVFTNALTFNEPGSDIALWALQLRDQFEAQFEKLRASVTSAKKKPATSVPDLVPPVAPAPPPRAPEMSHSARAQLGQAINQLSAEQLLKIVQIINESPMKRQQAGGDEDSNGDIEIDLSDLDNATLFRLKEFVESCLPPVALQKKISLPTSVATQKGTKSSKKRSRSEMQEGGQEMKEDKKTKKKKKSKKSSKKDKKAARESKKRKTSGPSPFDFQPDTVLLPAQGQ